MPDTAMPVTSPTSKTLLSEVSGDTTPSDLSARLELLSGLSLHGCPRSAPPSFDSDFRISQNGRPMSPVNTVRPIPIKANSSPQMTKSKIKPDKPKPTISTVPQTPLQPLDNIAGSMPVTSPALGGQGLVPMLYTDPTTGVQSVIYVQPMPFPNPQPGLANPQSATGIMRMPSVSVRSAPQTQDTAAAQQALLNVRLQSQPEATYAQGSNSAGTIGSSNDVHNMYPPYYHPPMSRSQTVPNLGGVMYSQQPQNMGMPPEDKGILPSKPLSGKKSSTLLKLATQVNSGIAAIQHAASTGGTEPVNATTNVQVVDQQTVTGAQQMPTILPPNEGNGYSQPRSMSSSTLQNPQPPVKPRSPVVQSPVTSSRSIDSGKVSTQPQKVRIPQQRSTPPAHQGSTTTQNTADHNLQYPPSQSPTTIRDRSLPRKQNPAEVRPGRLRSRPPLTKDTQRSRPQVNNQQPQQPTQRSVLQQSAPTSQQQSSNQMSSTNTTSAAALIKSEMPALISQIKNKMGDLNSGGNSGSGSGLSKTLSNMFEKQSGNTSGGGQYGGDTDSSSTGQSGGIQSSGKSVVNSDPGIPTQPRFFVTNPDLDDDSDNQNDSGTELGQTQTPVNDNNTAPLSDSQDLSSMSQMDQTNGATSDNQLALDQKQITSNSPPPSPIDLSGTGQSSDAIQNSSQMDQDQSTDLTNQTTADQTGDMQQSFVAEPTSYSGLVYPDYIDESTTEGNATDGNEDMGDDTVSNTPALQQQGDAINQQNVIATGDDPDDDGLATAVPATPNSSGSGNQEYVYDNTQQSMMTQESGNGADDDELGDGQDEGENGFNDNGTADDGISQNESGGEMEDNFGTDDPEFSPDEYEQDGDYQDDDYGVEDDNSQTSYQVDYEGDGYCSGD
jgi:hypothetical protein